MRFLVLLVFLTGFSLGQAQSRPYIPGLFDVQKVASDDVLNVRKTPGGTSEIVGTLDYDTQSVEVVTLSEDGKWGMVNSNDYSTGWVQLQFMSQTAPDPVATDFERDLWCFGDEPYWTLISIAKGDVFLLDGGNKLQLKRSFAPLLAEDRKFGRQVMVAGMEGIEITGFLTPKQCRPNEGVFGFGFDMLVVKGQERRSVSGCCSLSERGR